MPTYIIVVISAIFVIQGLAIQGHLLYVTLELPLHVAFVADNIWGFMLEPARTWYLVPGKAVDYSINSTAATTRVMRAVLVLYRYVLLTLVLLMDGHGDI